MEAMIHIFTITLAAKCMGHSHLTLHIPSLCSISTLTAATLVIAPERVSMQSASMLFIPEQQFPEVCGIGVCSRLRKKQPKRPPQQQLQQTKEAGKRRRQRLSRMQSLRERPRLSQQGRRKPRQPPRLSLPLHLRRPLLPPRQAASLSSALVQWHPAHPVSSSQYHHSTANKVLQDSLGCISVQMLPGVHGIQHDPTE